MKFYRLEFVGSSGHHWEVDHFRNKREALARARELLARDPDAEELKVEKIQTGKASPFEVIQALGARSEEQLTAFSDDRGELTREPVLIIQFGEMQACAELDKRTSRRLRRRAQSRA